MLIRLLELYPDVNWVWYYISSNPNITMEDIEKYPNKPWNWNSIYYNPNITMEFIKNNTYSIKFAALSWNKFNCKKK
jgi:hypothetical protein